MEQAIILVPGMQSTPRDSARDRLVASLCQHAQSYSISSLGEDNPDPEMPPRTATHRAVHNATGTSTDFSIHEIYWADLIPDYQSAPQMRRFRLGTQVFFYWIASSWSRKLLTSGDRMLTLFMLWSALSLLVWYLSLFVVTLDVAFQEFTPSSTDPAIASNSVLDFNSLVLAAKSSWLVMKKTITSTGIFGILLLLSPIFLPGVRNMARVSTTMMLFLRDTPFDTQDIGFRTALRSRIKTGLKEILDRPNPPDRIVLIAHSMGAPAVVDTLAEMGRALPRIELHTWGGAFGILTAREPLMQREIDSLMTAKPGLSHWHDVVVDGDVMSSALIPPDTPAAICPFSAVRVPRPRGGLLNFDERHMFYYRCQDAIEALFQLPRVAPAQDVAPAPLPRPAAG